MVFRCDSGVTRGDSSRPLIIISGVLCVCEGFNLIAKDSKHNIILYHHSQGCYTSICHGFLSKFLMSAFRYFEYGANIPQCSARHFRVTSAKMAVHGHNKPRIIVVLAKIAAISDSKVFIGVALDDAHNR